MVYSSTTVLVIIGGIALLIGLLGGGIEIGPIKFPHLDKWQRTFAGLVGAFLIGLGLVLDPSVRNPMSESIAVTPSVALASVTASSTAVKPEPSIEPEVADSSFGSSTSESVADALPITTPPMVSSAESLTLLPDTLTLTATNAPLPSTTSTATPTVVTLTPSVIPTPVNEELLHDTSASSPATVAATLIPEPKPVSTPLLLPTTLAAMSSPNEDWHRGLNYAPDKGLSCNDLVGVNYQPPRCTDPLIDGQNEYVSILLLEGAREGLDEQKMDALWQQITAMAPKVFRSEYQIDPNFLQAYLVYDRIGAYNNDMRWDIVRIEYGSTKGRLYIIPPGQYSGSIPDGMEAIRVY